MANEQSDAGSNLESAVTSGSQPSQNAVPTRRREIDHRDFVNSLYDFGVRVFRSATTVDRALPLALTTARSRENGATSLFSLYMKTARLLYEAAADSPSMPKGSDVDSLGRLGTDGADWLGNQSGLVIWRIASQLPADQYAALHLQIRMGLSPGEVAECLGISASYALVLLGRARRSFEDSVVSPLLIHAGATTCEFIARRAAAVRGGEAMEAQAEDVRRHVAGGCEHCQSLLASFGPLSDLILQLAPQIAPESVAQSMLQQLDEIDLRKEVADTIEDEPADKGTTPMVAAPDDGFDDSAAAPDSFRERALQWLMDRDIPMQAVAGAAGLVVLVVLIGAVLVIGRARSQAVDQSSAVAAVSSPTSVLPTTTTTTATPTSTESETGAPQPSATPTTAIIKNNSATSSIFRIGRPATVVATPGPDPRATGSEDRPRSIFSSIDEALAGQEDPVEDDALLPWITATPQNLGASGPGTNGQLIILNSATTRTSNEDRPRQSSQGSDSGVGDSGNSTPPATKTPPPPPTPPPPKLAVSAASVVFGKGETVKTITISNAGTGQFTWTATPQQAWILLSPSGGTVNESVSMQIRVDRELAGLGAKNGVVSLRSSAGTVNIAVSVQ